MSKPDTTPIRRGTGANARVRAASLFAQWRADGVPTVITSHEAYLLTDGRVGIEGNREAALGLARVAQIVEGAR